MWNNFETFLKEIYSEKYKVETIARITKIAPSASIVYHFWYFYICITQIWAAGWKTPASIFQCPLWPACTMRRCRPHPFEIRFSLQVQRVQLTVFSAAKPSRKCRSSGWVPGLRPVSHQMRFLEGSTSLAPISTWLELFMKRAWSLESGSLHSRVSGSGVSTNNHKFSGGLKDSIQSPRPTCCNSRLFILVIVRIYDLLAYY